MLPPEEWEQLAVKKCKQKLEARLDSFSHILCQPYPWVDLNHDYNIVSYDADNDKDDDD